MIDQVHRLMHLWRAGDQAKVDEYLDARALASNRLLHRVLQALIELAAEASGFMPRSTAGISNGEASDDARAVVVPDLN